jgi:uncharacterized protein (UPF0261 family)
MAVLLVGTLDTKGDEVAFVRDELRRLELEVIVIDAGSSGVPKFTADVSREKVFAAAHSGLNPHTDRGEAVTIAASGVRVIALEHFARGAVDGILALGGSAGTTIGTSAMRALPFGLPKVMVSTLASGQTRPYVEGSDLVLFPSVADVSGLNRVTRTVFKNAAAALSGMVRERQSKESDVVNERHLITATMFGVTTPCVSAAQGLLESKGYEVIVFHATGVGGQAMEGLIRDGQTTGVLDLTTTEIADDVVGGVLTAGPDRLAAGIKARVPQVISLGALDMVNFGPAVSVPERFQGRLLHVHNRNVTLMRTTVDENRRIGERMVQMLAAATSRVDVLIPLRGLSALDAPGGDFHDPAADGALFHALRHGLSGHDWVRITERDEHINDPAFSACAVELLLAQLEGQP